MGDLVSRRTLLKGGAAVGAALGVAAVVRLPAPSEQRQVLSAVEAEVVAAIALTLFPPGVFAVDGAQAGCVARVDEILAGFEAVHRNGFRYLLRAIEWGAMGSHGRRFTRLDPGARLAVLQIWADPDPLPRRIAFDSVKMVLGMAFFSNPAVQDAIGYRSLCRSGVS